MIVFPTHPSAQQLQLLSCRESSSLKGLQVPVWGPQDGTTCSGSPQARKREWGLSALERRHIGTGEKIQPTKSQEQRSRGTIAHPASPGELWTALGTEGCGTGVRGHRLHLCGSFWMCPHPPPAPAHPTSTAKGAQVPSSTQLWLSSSPRQMFPSLDLSIPKAMVWSLLGRLSLEPVATHSPATLLSGFTASRSGGMCRSCSHGGCWGRTAATVPAKGSCPSGRNPGATQATATTLHLHLHPHPGHGEGLGVPAGTWP